MEVNETREAKTCADVKRSSGKRGKGREDQINNCSNM
jgi:hypothetical protein